MTLGFPYCGNTGILTLPMEHHGLDFPSVARINAGLVIEGLARDLNHHIPASRRGALITLADWMCAINGCIGPLDGIGLNQSFSHHYRKIPATWIIVQNSMTSMRLKLSFHLTEHSHILRGKMSISHTLNSCKARGIDVPNGHAIRSLETRGICMLSHAGKWIKAHDNKLVFTTTDFPVPQAQWTDTAKENWRQVSSFLNGLNSRWLFDGDPTLLMMRIERQAKAENYIHGLSHILSMPPSTTHHQN